jgi:hypothetical protein
MVLQMEDDFGRYGQNHLPFQVAIATPKLSLFSGKIECERREEHKRNHKRDPACRQAPPKGSAIPFPSSYKSNNHVNDSSDYSCDKTVKDASCENPDHLVAHNESLSYIENTKTFPQAFHCYENTGDRAL